MTALIPNIDSLPGTDGTFGVEDVLTDVDLFETFEDAAEQLVADIVADNDDYIVSTGMYRVDGTVFKVRPNRAETHHYAMRLNAETDKFDYAAGAMRVIRAEHRMSLDDAREYGRLTGHCIVCSALLTDPDSIEYGIGPICRNKF